MAEKNSKVITRQYTIKDSKKNTVTKKKIMAKGNAKQKLSCLK